MCDTVIDEHFRRSLGNNYMELFDKTQGVTVPAGSNGASSPPAGAAALAVAKTGMKRIVKSPSPPMAKAASTVSVSVDDHFAKALGETWNKLKATHRREEGTDEEDIDGDLDDFSEEGSEDQQEEDDFEEDDEDDAETRIRRKNKRLRTDRKI